MDEYLIDHIQHREEENLQAAIEAFAKKAPTQKYTTPEESPYQECTDCGGYIGEFRMLRGLPRCVGCQEDHETRERHFGR